MTAKIFVYIDHFDGQALSVSWEAVGAARALAAQTGGSVAALLLGDNVDSLAQEALHYGADEVLLAKDPTLKDYRAEPFTDILAAQAKAAAPEIFLFPTTTRGRELAATTAIDLNTGVLTDVTALELEGGQLTAVKPVYAGKLLAKVVCHTRPQIATLRGRAFPKPAPDAARGGTITPVPVVAAPSATEVEGYAETEAGVSLTDAAVIVSGGRGVSNNPALTPPNGLNEKEAEIWRAHEGFKLVGALAEALGGAVGASRAAVDAGYIPYSHQVGQTGKVVAPDLYIACGISGAIQHLAGMRTSKTILAINKDPEASIFKLARFGVVGDLYAILPPLTEAFRTRLGK